MIILCLVGRYLPGVKAGGPIRSAANLVEALGDEFEFRVVTSDRDLGDVEPYPGVARDQWVRVGKGEVMYLSPGCCGLGALARLIRDTPHDVLYLNSFFCDEFTIRPLLLRRLRLIPHRPVVLAPRGELAHGALSLKRMKKTLYRNVARALGLCAEVTWQASSAAEEADIRREIGAKPRVVVGPDVFVPRPAAVRRRSPKEPGSARLVCISRVSPVKNLHWLAEVLPLVRASVSLDLFGLVDSPDYWTHCQEAFAKLPANVSVAYRGAVPHGEVSALVSQYDLFALPTLGENFGHAIAEALAAGCPALISDQTPWHGLEEARAGWDLPLTDPRHFADAIQRVVDMDEAEHAEWRRGAEAYVSSHPLVTQAVDQNRRLFLTAAGG